VLKPVFKQIHNIEFLLLIRWIVLGADIEKNTLAPFIKILDPVQKRNDELSIDIDSTLVSQNLIHSLNSIDRHKWIFVFCQLIKFIEKIGLLETTFAQVEELDATYNGSLLYVGVNIV